MYKLSFWLTGVRSDNRRASAMPGRRSGSA
jgi:hypothetical protein